MNIEKIFKTVLDCSFQAKYYFDVLAKEMHFVRILKGFKVIAQGEVKRSPEI